MKEADFFLSDIHASECRAALIRGDVAGAKVALAELQNETFLLSVKTAAEKHGLCLRLRGILSYGEAHGGISREEASLLHELRRLPDIKTAFDSKESTAVFSQINKAFARVDALATRALEARRRQSETL